MNAGSIQVLGGHVRLSFEHTHAAHSHFLLVLQQAACFMPHMPHITISLAVQVPAAHSLHHVTYTNPHRVAVCPFSTHRSAVPSGLFGTLGKAIHVVCVHVCATFQCSLGDKREKTGVLCFNRHLLDSPLY